MTNIRQRPGTGPGPLPRPAGTAGLALPGKLIAVEGLDGSGKSTQIYLLKRWLEIQELKVYFTEWNSSVIVKQITSKAKKLQLLTSTTFSLIHCTDFADRYERQILPLLHAGYIVLCDRYLFTALARDTARNCHPEWVANLYSFARKPDITFFFNLPLKTALGRILAGRPKLKYHEAGMDLNLSNDITESFRLFQGKINNNYRKMVKKYGFTVMDATRSIEQQQEEVRKIVARKIDLTAFKWKARR